MHDLCDKTGSWITGEELLRQKISRVLLTQKGSKPVMRSFGSNLRRYIDLPLPEFKAYATQEIFQKLEQYIPELKCESVEFAGENMIIKGKAEHGDIAHVIST